jgi:hypothetical protein
MSRSICRLISGNRLLMAKAEKEDHWEGLSVDGSIILKEILKIK